MGSLSMPNGATPQPGALGIDDVLTQMNRASAQSETEADLRTRIEPIFRAYLEQIGVSYEPGYERSIASKSRVDALFGKVITEYKRPNELKGSRVQGYIEQLQGYLEDEATRQGDDIGKYAGVLLDGKKVLFTRKRPSGWFNIGPEELNLSNVKLLLEHYRSLSRKPLEPNAITAGLGSDSAIAKDMIRALLSQLQNPRGKTKLLYTEWRRLFGQVSGYEAYQVSPEIATTFGIERSTDGLSKWFFAAHTYFAIVIKLIAAEILTIYRGKTLDSFVSNLAVLSGVRFKAQFAELEDGHVFRVHGVENFLEGDFFSWYVDAWSPQIETELSLLVQHLREYEPATSILDPDSVRDLLKNLYQNLVPKMLRHDLGEYYTPDWLAEYVIQGAGYDGDLNERALDPNCGSGTFLLLALRKAMSTPVARGMSPSALLERLRKNIVGFDLNPLAVIAARTNYLIAIGELLRDTSDPIEIPIYLSDSIFSPSLIPGQGAYDYQIHTDRGPLTMRIPAKLVEAELVSVAMSSIEKAVVNSWTEEQCVSQLKSDLRSRASFWEEVKEPLLAIFRQVSELERNGWNRIWCRIIKNRFASASVGQFDYIIGNPAWVRWSRLPASYKETVKSICESYDIFSEDNWVGGIESDISTVLTYAAADKWLKDKGRLAYVITQTVFKTKSSEGFRRFTLPDGKPMRIDHVDDMVAIKPFENATNKPAVLFLTKAEETRYPIPYHVWEKLTQRSSISSDSSLAEVKRTTFRNPLVAFPMHENNNTWVCCKNEDIEAVKKLIGSSDLHGRKGVTTDLNNVFWVSISETKGDRSVIIQNNLDNRSNSHQVERFVGPIEKQLVYQLVRGRDIGPFHWEPSDRYIIMPQSGMIGMPEAELVRSYPQAASYFARYRTNLANRASFRRFQSKGSAPYYSLWNVGEYTFADYKVVWREIGLPFVAAVISARNDQFLGRKTPVADHKLMHVSCDSKEEAHYLCAVFNSSPIRELVESFVVDTQVGARIFKWVNIPNYEGTPEQVELANLSITYHTKDAIRDSDQSALDGLVRALLEAHTNNGQKQAFQRLAHQWLQERKPVSSVVKMADHPAYKEIIRMGEQAVPLLLEELERKPDHWFFALHMITGADPVPKEARGKLPEMARAWIEWGKEKGYRW